MDRLRAPWNHPHRVGSQSVDDGETDLALAKGGRMKSSLIFWVALLLTLAGCARFEPHPLSPDKSATALENRALDSKDLEPFLKRNLQRELTDWPLKTWDL